MERKTLDYIINHLFLPPKLPQEDDSKDYSLQKALLQHISACAGLFCDALDNIKADGHVRACWAALRTTLERFARIHDAPHVSQDDLEKIMRGIQLEDVVCLHILSQNAGVIFRRTAENFDFEFFQASPSALSITGTKGKLIIQYPTRPRLAFPRDEDFIAALSALLAALDCTSMPEAIPTAQKAHQIQAEHRDVRDIRYISEMLGGIARGLTPTGDVEAIAESTVYVTKRINDHVLWKAALLPWRRSPKWLVVRVALQTTLKGWKIDEKYGYKVFVTFILAKTLELAGAAGVSHDLLFLMSAKIATRMWKLGSIFPTGHSPPPFPLDFISSQIEAVHSLVTQTWEAVQAREARTLPWVPLTRISLKEAQDFALSNSVAYLDTVRARAHTLDTQDTAFNSRAFEARLGPPSPILSDSSSDSILWLAILREEKSVAELGNWNLSPSQRLSKLAKLIEHYDKVASDFRSTNPAFFSRIFLLVLELWVAFDQIATSQFPLLLDYSPEVSFSSFDPLLLPERSQMQRLRNIELYVTKRHTDARYLDLSVFTFDADPESLPSRHFSADIGLQSLKNKIEMQALHRRDQKIEELHSMTSRWTAIIEERDRQEHAYHEDRWGNTKHDEQCGRCAKQKEVESMTITVFEWPLPENNDLCRLVLFELCLPTVFGLWRDTTYRLARNHSNVVSSTSPSPSVLLRDYDLLSEHFVSNIPSQQITIASTAKPFSQSHYFRRHFPCNDNDIIQKHPLMYALWDSSVKEWLPSSFPTIDIRDSCTPQLPIGPYKALAWTVVGTTHDANDVIARQSECPLNLSHHAWGSFGHLRAGVRLQWRNMMLQLATGTIELADPAVYLLFRQAAWQAEAPGDEELGLYREAHFDLSMRPFGREVVPVLEKRLDCISGNWQEGWTAATLSVIACRLFSLSDASAVKAQVRAFLAKLRKVLFGWMKQVLEQLKGNRQAVSRTDLVNRVLQLAASCRSTYSVILDEIFTEPEAISIFVQCAIAIHSNVPASLSNLISPLRYLLHGDVLLSAEASSSLVNSISQTGEGLDMAIHAIWDGFHRHESNPWRSISNGWMACETPSSPDRQIRHVYLNILNGSFLVDGRSQSIPPREISSHYLFKILFPTHDTLEIVPSTMMGMDYQSRDNLEGFEVHFKLKNGELLVRTRNTFNDAISEFIPPKRFKADLPKTLLHDMVHLFHEQSVDIFAAPTGWNPRAAAEWTMPFSPGTRRTLSKVGPTAHVALLCPSSHVAQNIHQIFRPLESDRTMLLISLKSGSLHINLPRYNLEFSLSASSARLESKEFPGFYVSPKQYIGTLIGLESKLVLKSRQDDSLKVIVPEGSIAFMASAEHHLTVTIRPSPTAQHIKAFIYDVDEIIGRLVGDGTLTSWFSLAYLHILTSSYLPDPLIRRTGIQQALEMMRSSQSFAFMELKPEHNQLLQRIVRLAPVRQYYPPFLKSMETIRWNDELLPFIQCGQFVPLVDDIVEYARKQTVFYTARPQLVTYEGDVNLRERAEFRTSRLVSNELGRETVTDLAAAPTRHLVSHDSRSREQAVWAMVSLVRQWPPGFPTTDNLWKHVRGWGAFSSVADGNVHFGNPRIWLEESPSKIWCNLLSLCMSESYSTPKNKYGLMIALGILAYRQDINLELVRTLLAVAIHSATFKYNGIPPRLPQDQFHLLDNRTLIVADILNVVKAHCHSWADVGPDDFGSAGETVISILIPRAPNEAMTSYNSRKARRLPQLKSAQCFDLSRHIFELWPDDGASDLTVPNNLLIAASTDTYPLIDVRSVALRNALKDLFAVRLRNRGLFECVSRLQAGLSSVHQSSSEPRPFLPNVPMIVKPHPKYQPVTLCSLLADREAPNLETAPQSSIPGPATQTTSRKRKRQHTALCRDLVSRFQKLQLEKSTFPSQYIDDLTGCVEAFEQQQGPSRQGRPEISGDSGYIGLETEIERILGPKTLLERILYQTGQWPSFGPESLVRQLSREFRTGLLDTWRAVLSRFAQGLTFKQHRRRAQDSEALGYQGWDPATYPDWQLFQLDADLLIRPVQASIAEQMMSPEGNKNALMQLNMGEGKSSVIVPIVSVALANGEQLVRVVVLKPLSAQMFQLLKQRVSGLVSRRLFYLPFSRDIQLDCAKIQQIVALLKECATVGGILLCQPEHILSFQLAGLHNLCQTQSSEETPMLMNAQKWLDSSTRDILDESDEILSVRYQLIYTVGTAMPLEGQPWRWSMIQQVFTLLDDVAKELPSGLQRNPGTESSRHSGTESSRFPVTRIITTEGGRTLLEIIVKRIVFEDQLNGLSFRTCSTDDKRLVSRFLQRLQISQQESTAVQTLFGDRFSRLLLLRGLFVHGILKLALQEKRWRVDFGLDPSRSMLAVPYRAKDSPAPRAEFGHPDMIIALTCLSYYYGGLTDDQLNTAFENLLQSSNPELDYENWVKRVQNPPKHLTSLRGVNLDNFEERSLRIFPLLRHNKAVIDFYLSHCVFPKEARGFPHKLTTNAWDLARRREKITTGFSGTNDNKYLLPLSIRQLDQDSQQHTNAQVLEYILKLENREVLCTESDDARGLLQRLVQQTPPVMVLLDVGAQVLELRNDDVARAWLELDKRPHIEAAVYFNSHDDEIRVLTRDGRVEPFASSLYNNRLDKTLVYLDEAHTRGTDFKFPPETRAVVTLGPKLTKDKLVQGCMRLRRLGEDHSVLFFASGEILEKITAACDLESFEILDSSHVLLWTMRETCAQIKNHGALWANQGINFDTRRTAYEEHLRGTLSDEEFAAVLREPESRTLQELYGVKSAVSEDRNVDLSQRRKEILERCKRLGASNSGHGVLLEEQERELAHETEQEREVERIPKAEACRHRPIDKNILKFIETPSVNGVTSFLPLRTCLINTSQFSLLPPGTFFQSHHLYATRDFRDTIILSQPTGSIDNYLRPVQWILSNSKSDILLLLSPFEANELLPRMRTSTTAHLHLYAPRVSQTTLSFEELDRFTVPKQRQEPFNRDVIHELNLFAGQLFFEDKESMERVCSILGLYLKPTTGLKKGVVDSSGFVKGKQDRGHLGMQDCTFVSNPLPFIRELFGWRRKGQGFGLTHMGKVLNGINLDDSDFEQSSPVKFGTILTAVVADSDAMDVD
ncbi:hypothetical protein FB451DRAFT_100343 [Mycena latifolia]|nr:hypothetical protein FB451DRAFT_100343 [Mycena latifolia]